MIREEEDCPRQSFVFEGFDSGLRFPAISKWPISKSFSFCVWLKIETPKVSMIDENQTLPVGSLELYCPHVICLRDSSGTGLECYLRPAGQQANNSSGNSSGAFNVVLKYHSEAGETSKLSPDLDGMNIREGVWHFLAFTVSTASFFGGKGEASIQLNDQYVRHAFQVPKFPEPIAEPMIGTCPKNCRQLGHNSTMRGQMGAFYMFSEALTESQLRCIYGLGPNYLSNFEQFSISYVEISQRAKTQQVDSKNILDGSLTGSIILTCNAAVWNGDLFLDNTPTKNDVRWKQPAANSHTSVGRKGGAASEDGRGDANYVQMHARRLPGTYRSSTQDVRMALNSLGGVKSILPMFAQVDQPRMKSQRSPSFPPADRSPLRAVSVQRKSVSSKSVTNELASKEAALDYSCDTNFLPAILELMISLLDGNVESWGHYARYRIGVVSTLLERAAPWHFSHRVLDLLILLQGRLLDSCGGVANKFTDVYLDLMLCNFKLWAFADVDVQLRLINWIEDGVRASAIFPRSARGKSSITSATEAVSFRRIVDVLFLLYDYELPKIDSADSASCYCGIPKQNSRDDGASSKSTESGAGMSWKDGSQFAVSELQGSIYYRRKWTLPGTDRILAERMSPKDLQTVRKHLFNLLVTTLIAQKAVLPENVQDLIQYCLRTRSTKSKIEVIQFLSRLLLGQEHTFFVPHTLLGLTAKNCVGSLSVLLFHEDLMLRSVAFSFICNVVEKARKYKILPPLPVDQRTRLEGVSNDGRSTAVADNQEESFGQGVSVAIPITPRIGDSPGASTARSALLDAAVAPPPAELNFFSETMTSLGLGAEGLSELININAQILVNAAQHEMGKRAEDGAVPGQINVYLSFTLCSMLNMMMGCLNQEMYTVLCDVLTEVEQSGSETWDQIYGRAINSFVEQMQLLISSAEAKADFVVLPYLLLPTIKLVATLPIGEKLRSACVNIIVSSCQSVGVLAESVCKIPNWHCLMINFLHPYELLLSDVGDRNADLVQLQGVHDQLLRSITEIITVRVDSAAGVWLPAASMVAGSISSSAQDRLDTYKRQLLAIHGVEIMKILRNELSSQNLLAADVLVLNIHKRLFFYNIYIVKFKKSLVDRLNQVTDSDFLACKLLHLEVWMALQPYLMTLKDLESVLRQCKEAVTAVDQLFDWARAIMDECVSILGVISEKIAVHLYNEDAFDVFSSKPVSVDMSRADGNGSSRSPSAERSSSVLSGITEKVFSLTLDSPQSGDCRLTNASGGIHWLLLRCVSCVLSIFASKDASEWGHLESWVAQMVEHSRTWLQSSWSENPRFFQLESLHMLFQLNNADIASTSKLAALIHPLVDDITQQNRQLVTELMRDSSNGTSADADDADDAVDAGPGASTDTGNALVRLVLAKDTSDSSDSAALSKLRDRVKNTIIERDTLVLRTRLQQLGFRTEDNDVSAAWTFANASLSNDEASVSREACDFSSVKLWCNRTLQASEATAEEFVVRVRMYIRQNEAANRRFDMRWTKIFRELANERGPWGYGASDRSQTYWMLGDAGAKFHLKRVLRRNDQETSHIIATQRAKGVQQIADADGAAVEADNIMGIYQDLRKYKKKHNTNVAQKDDDDEDDGNSDGEEMDVAGGEEGAVTTTQQQQQQPVTVTTGPTVTTLAASGIDLIASQAFNIISNDSTLFAAQAEMITPATNSTGCRSRGRVELSRSRMSFLRENESSNFDFVNKSNNDEFLWACQCFPSVSWNIDEICGVYRRHYQLRYVAAEVFFVNRTAVLINFFSKRTCKAFIRIIRTKLRPPQCAEVFVGRPMRAINAVFMPGLTVTQAWVQRKISNFEYLMHLNFIAGRTFNDLSQYPVFPWVIADYNSYQADLRNPSFFRNFKWPMGAQRSVQRNVLRRTYENSLEMADMDILPYHTGSHYSTSAMVIWYLIRMEPFTSYHVWLQDGKFDHPDRLFHSLPACYNGCISNPQDVKELVPEFFYNPEILENVNYVELGTTQKGEVVDDVTLPAWAKDALDFVRIHNDALESDFVSMNLHHWIDLIFGYKQRPPHIRGGHESAVEACNVYMHLTYADAVNLDDIKVKDSMLYDRLIRQIENFGQTPNQIFQRPHPSRLPFDQVDLTWPIASIVPGVDTIVRGSRIILDKPTRVLTYGEFKVSSSPILLIFDCRSLERLVTVDATRVIGYHNFQWRPPDIVPPFVMKIDRTAISASSGQLAATGGKKVGLSLLNYGYGSSNKDKMAGIPFAAQGVLAPSSIGRLYSVIKDFNYDVVGTPEGKRSFLEELSQSRKKAVFDSVKKTTATKTTALQSAAAGGGGGGGGSGAESGVGGSSAIRSLSTAQISRTASSANDVQYRFDQIGVPQRITSPLRGVDRGFSESAAAFAASAASEESSATSKTSRGGAASQSSDEALIKAMNSMMGPTPSSSSTSKSMKTKSAGAGGSKGDGGDVSVSGNGTAVDSSLGSNSISMQRKERVADHLSGNLFAILPDTKFLFSCGHWDNSFKVTMVDSGRMVQSVTHHKEVVTCLTVASDLGRHWLVTGSRDCIVIIWELNIMRENEPIVYPPSFYLYGHDDSVNCVAVNAELDLVVSGSDDGTLMLHSLRDGSYLRSIIIGATISSKSPLAQAKNSSRSVRVTDSTRKSVAAVTSSRKANVSSSMSFANFEHRAKRRVSLLAISSNGFIISYCVDGNLLSAHTINGRYVKSVDARERLYALCFSEDGRVLVTGGERCLVVMRWVSNLSIANNGPRRDLDSVVDGAHEPDYPPMKSPIRSLHLTAQERHLVVGLESGVVRILAQVNVL